MYGDVATKWMGRWNFKKVERYVTYQQERYSEKEEMINKFFKRIKYSPSILINGIVNAIYNDLYKCFWNAINRFPKEFNLSKVYSITYNLSRSSLFIGDHSR